MTRKKYYYCYDETVGGRILFDTIDYLIVHLVSYLAELKDEDEISFDCGTILLTDKEVEEMPES